MYTFHVLTLFPDMMTSPLDVSIVGRARRAGHIEVQLHDIRDLATDRHRTVDDVPFGGGPGMVMKSEPVVGCIERVRESHAPAKVLLLSPSGDVFDQQMARDLAGLESLALVCGHYEGVDDRVHEHVDGVVSIGDFVITGGELAALVVLDAVARYVPGVLGNPMSMDHESFTGAELLEYPQYTRPRRFRDQDVPEVLLSGDHERIRLWRRKESLRRTLIRRPDLLARHAMNDEDKALLEEIRGESGEKT